MSVPSGAYARKKIAGGVTYYGKPITGDIIEVVPGSCDFSNPELDCKAAGTYQVTVENATLTDIVWSTTFGEISTGQGTETVQISTDTGFDVEFDLTITATVVPDNLSEPFPGTRTETFNHTHTDTSIPMTVTSIVRDLGGICTYPVGGTCQATSVFSATTANGNGNKTYLWEVTGEGTISGSKTDSTVTVIGLDDNDNDTYDVKVTINDRTQTGATITQQFVDTKVEDIPINITSINRDSGGTCDYLQSGSCSAQSVYSVQYEESNGPVSYIWKVDGGASIVGSVAEATVTVNGPDTDIDDFYNVTCTVTDDNGFDTDSQSFSDTKTEIPPLVIDSINRDSGGTCDFYEGSAGCSAESTYSVSISGSVSTVSYQWLVDNEATISGSSTSSTVIIDGSTTTTDDSYNVTCQVTDDSGSDTQVTQFSDTKTELPSITIDSINRDSGGTCDYPSGGSCVAESTYSASISDSISAISYQWLVDSGASISGSSTNSTVTVNGPDTGTDDSYNVTCQVTDDSGSDTQVTQFSDTKTELPPLFAPLDWGSLIQGLNTGDLKDIRGLSTDNNGVWVANCTSGFASRSADDGLTWTLLPQGLNVGIPTQTSSSSATDKNGTWMVPFGSGQISRSLDNGITWAELSPKGLNSGSTTGFVYAVNTDNNGVWVNGQASGFTSRSIDNGNTWAALPQGLNSGNTTASILSLKHGQNDVWIAGLSSGYAARSVDNGATWAALPRGLGGEAAQSNNSIDTDNNGTWVVVRQNGYASRSTDNGANWNELPRGLNSGGIAIQFAAVCTDKNGNWWALGSSGYTSYSTDNGATWQAGIKGLNTGSETGSGKSCAENGNGVWITGWSTGFASRNPAP